MVTRAGTAHLNFALFAKIKVKMSTRKYVIGSDRLRSPVDMLTVPTSRARRKILRDGARANEVRDAAFRRIILSIPAGKVSTYGRVAAAAGYPLYHRAVARLLRTDPPDHLPWHRVLGAGGEIKLRDEAAKEQRARLKMEGVKFRGKRVDMDRFEYAIRSWETFD
jgi:methylated-DNA-protein-cysteine methyltransferase related protein